MGNNMVKYSNESLIISLAKSLLIICMIPMVLSGQSFMTDKTIQNQKNLSRYVTAEYDNATLISIIRDIAEESGLALNYNPRRVDLDKKVTMTFENKRIEDALAKLLYGTGVSFWISGYSQLALNQAGVVASVNTLHLQEVIVEGRVVDADTGDPLPYTNILVRGTSIGTSADQQGNFSIQVPDPESDVLLVTHVGYTTVEIEVAGRSQIVIELTLVDLRGEELVVIGYGRERRDRLTGTIGSVSSEVIERRVGALSVEQTLQGRISGVDVRSNSGIPGQGLRVNVRGAGSISAGNEPLYVVDGIPIEGGGSGRLNLGIGRESPISHLEPSDIESIHVLKDAAATAIYGSRATNGVVLIQTRRGKAGPTHIDFSTRTGFKDIPNPLKLVGIETWYEVKNEAIANYNQDRGFEPGQIGYRHPQEAPDMEAVNWLDLVTRDYALSQTNRLSISGGTEDTRVFFSGAYNLDEGIILTNQFRRVSGRLSVDHRAHERLNVSGNLNLNQTRNNRIQNEGSGRGIFVRSLEQPPWAEPFHEDGSYKIGGVDIPRHNGLQVINEQNLAINRYIGLFDFSANLRLSPYIDFDSKFGGEFGFIHENTYINENHPRGQGGGVARDWREIRRNLLAENTLNFNYAVSGDWNFSGLIGHSFQTYEMELNYVNARDFPSPSFRYITSAGEIVTGHSGWTGYNLNSYLGRVNINYRDRYDFTSTLRRDGSSKFMGDNRYGMFPSIAAGWRVSSESFFRELNISHVVSNLRFRAGYGQTGNQDGISNFIAIPSATGGHSYLGQTGIAITASGNPDLRWETSNQYNISMELGLFRNRINFEANYFYQITDDLLFNRPVHGTTGFSNQIENIGSISNRGLEIEISTENIRGIWSTDFNIAIARNRVEKLFGDAPIIYGSHILMEGEPMGTFYMLKQIGIYQSNDEVPELLFAQGVRAGDVKFEDINGDGNITEADRQVVGNANPKFYGGFMNTLRIRSFDLNIQVDFRYGNKIYYNAGENIGQLGNLDRSIHKPIAENRWTGPNTSNTVPRASLDHYNLRTSTRFLEDGSFIRLQSVDLRYNVPPNVLERLGLRRAQLILSGSNLITLTGYSGMDPDVSVSLNPITMGTDYFNVPNMRSFNVGLNIGI